MSNGLVLFTSLMYLISMVITTKVFGDTHPTSTIYTALGFISGIVYSNVAGDTFAHINSPTISNSWVLFMFLLCFISMMITTRIMGDTMFTIYLVWGFACGIVYNSVTSDIFSLQMQK